MIVGVFPVAQGPVLPVSQAAQQTQVSGRASGNIPNRTIQTPADGQQITITPGGTFNVYPSMQDPSSLLGFFINAGIRCHISRAGLLMFPDATSVTGDANTLTALGIQ
jgi:hypothetical protein